MGCPGLSRVGYASSRVGQCDGAVTCRADDRGVLGKRAVRVARSDRLPALLAIAQLLLAQLHLDDAALGIDVNYVAIFKKRDRPAHIGFGSHVADAETARGATETAIGEQR